jgi:putative LysE/RhtB family amino acid efflux pump
MDVLLGFALGVAVVAPVGPISLLLVAIGLERGRSDGIRAGLGVAGADLLLLVVVLASSQRLAGLGDHWQRRIEVALAAGMLIFGLHAICNRDGVTSIVGRIRRPFRTLLMATVGNPMSLMVWLGLVVTLGSKFGGGAAMLRVGLGLALASVTWHVMLGAAAGSVGTRLDERTRLIVQRSSGIAMVGLAAALVA